MRLLISKVGERIELNHHTLHEDTYVYVSILTSRCVVNEDGGDSEVLELRNYEASRNYSTEREKEREREREREREAEKGLVKTVTQGGGCLRAVLGNLRLRIAAFGGRKHEWGGRVLAEERRGWLAHGREEATLSAGEGRNRAARSYRRQSKCNYPPPM